MLVRPYLGVILKSTNKCRSKIRYLSIPTVGNGDNDATTVTDTLVRMNKPKVRIDQIVKQKNQTVHTITDISTVEEAISHLVNHKTGSSLVTNINGDIVGIYTARDILSFINKKGPKKAVTSLTKEFMTTKDKLVYISPHDTARRAREMMFQLKIRNMPVIENGEVLGIVTIKDLADSAFSIEDTGGKKGFIENVIGRKGLPQGTKLKDKNNATTPNSTQQKLYIEYSSHALTHPFKKKDGVAGRRRDYGAEDLCQDLSLCEDAHFTLKVNTKHNESLSQVYLGIADGVGSWRQYGVDPKQFAHKLVDNARQVIESDALQRDVLTGSGIGLGLLDQDPIHPVDIIMDAWNMTTYEKITGSSTICVAWIDRKYNQLSYSNIGDCGLMIVRHIDSETAGYMRERNVPRHLRKNDLRIAFLSQQQLKGFNLPYQLGFSGIKEHDGKFETPSDADSATIPIMAGDIIIMATDGLFDNLDLDEIVNEVSDWELKYFTSSDDSLQSAQKNSQTAMDKLAQQLVIKAREMSLDPARDSPFAVLAKDNDIMWGGGRPDDTTVIVARVFSDDNRKSYSNAEAAACALQVTNKFGLEYQKSVKECGSIEEAILKSIQVINENKTELDNITVFDFKKKDIATEVTEKINGTSYSILKELYDKCITENTMNIFYESLDTALSNPAILADSFRTMDIECSKDVYIDIDLDQIENLFMLILSDDKCYEQYDISIAKLVTNLKATASTITGADILKAFMLPLYEYIDLDLDPSKQDTSKIKNLFSAIDELSSNSKIMLSKWLKSQGTSDTTSKNYVRYKRYVSICCQFLTLQYYAGELEDSKLGTRVLAIFYTAFSEYPTMSHEEFYNDAINEHIESRETLNAELRYWRQDRTKQSQTTISDPSHYLTKSYRSFISYPFLLQAGIKSDILEKDAAVQMRSSINNEIQWAMTHGQQYVIPYLILRVQRENILQDTLSMIFHFEDKDFKKPLKVIFDNEDGVDAGGVRKEYYQLMLKQLLDPSFGMFQYYPETRLLWFNPNGLDLVTPDEYKLIGTLLGIAIFNSIILDLPFPSYLYKKLKRNRPNLSTLSDLESIQPLLAKSLKFLLDYDKDDIEDVFDFTFQINYKDVFECVQTVDLKPNGANTKVNQQNKHEYVNLYIQYIMDVSIDPQFKAFEVGFRKVIDGFSMNLFEAKELELLICGSHTLDFDELERGSVYDDGYDENSQAIHNFWEIVKSYDETEKKLFLKFVSGSDRSPIEGLSKLKLVISKNGDDNSRLPSAHTCFNHLLLPEYSSIDIMREKLNYAITQAEGFGLR